MITVHKSESDDPGFLDEVQWMANGCLDQYQPAEVYVIHIRDWFDSKWCYFSGKRLGAIGVSKFQDLTLPPFVPNRVLAQDHYHRLLTTSDIYELSDAPPLHINQTSEANFKRFTEHATKNGMIIWFSSGSISTGRGSIMVYTVSPEIKFGWHATFLKKADWQIDKVTFTSKSFVKNLRNLGLNKSQNCPSK